MKLVRFLAKLLVILGAINWGLVGFFQYDAVANFFGGMASTSARFVYGIIGLAGLYKLIRWFCCGKSCGKCGPGCGCGCCSKKTDWKQ